MSKILILSGPSGIGKNHLANELVRHGFCPVPMATTRKPRSTEKDGLDYEFFSETEFRSLASQGKLMGARFFGACYGLRLGALEAALQQGMIPILFIYFKMISQYILKFPLTRRIYMYTEDLKLIEKRLLERDGSLDRMPGVHKELQEIQAPMYQQLYHRHIEICGDDLQPVIQTIQQVIACVRGDRL